jgi:hypothetical protein
MVADGRLRVSCAQHVIWPAELHVAVPLRGTSLNNVGAMNLPGSALYRADIYCAAWEGRLQLRSACTLARWAAGCQLKHDECPNLLLEC